MSFCGYCDPQKVAIRASARPSPYVISIAAFCGEKGLRDQPQRPCEHCVRLAKTWPPCSLPSTALQQLLVCTTSRSQRKMGQSDDELHLVDLAVRSSAAQFHGGERPAAQATPHDPSRASAPRANEELTMLCPAHSLFHRFSNLAANNAAMLAYHFTCTHCAHAFHLGHHSRLQA